MTAGSGTTSSASGALHPLPLGRRPTPFSGRLGVDVECLLPVSGLPCRSRRGRRVQREIHGEPVRAARRMLRHARRHIRPPTGTSSLPEHAGCSTAFDWQGPLSRMSYSIDVHLSPDAARDRMRSDAIAGLQADPKSIPPVWFYDERGASCLRKSPGSPSTTRRGRSAGCWSRTPRRSRNFPRPIPWSNSVPVRARSPCPPDALSASAHWPATSPSM